MRKSLAALAAAGVIVGTGVMAQPAQAMHIRETGVGGSAMRFDVSQDRLDLLPVCRASWDNLPCVYPQDIGGDVLSFIMTRSFVVIDAQTGLPVR